MNLRNSMIVGSDGMSAPSDSIPLLWGDEECSRKISLSIDGVQKHFSLHTRTQPLLILGRSKKCDIILPHTEVSSRHASLQLIGSHVYCVDLASQNGTFWDDHPRRSGWLRTGHPITIPPFSISSMPPDDGGLDDDALPELDLLSLQDFSRLPCNAELTFLNSRREKDGSKRWEILQPITLIGNNPRCRLQLDHSSVSRVHCSLIVTPDGLWIIDLLSHEGTCVNGERVNFRLLRQSDEIRIGCFQFSVNYKELSENNFFGSSQSQGTGQFEYLSQQSNRGKSGLSEEFVLSLLDRFSAMQRQMSNMNHQQMMVMSQLIGTMHQNHHDLVQRELTRIHRIDDQIQQIQQRLTGGDVSVEPVSPSEAQAVARHQLLRVPFEDDIQDPPANREGSQDIETAPEPQDTSEVVDGSRVLDDSDRDQNAFVGACDGVGVEAPLPGDKGDDDADQQMEELNTDEELVTNQTMENDAAVPDENRVKRRSVERDVDSHANLIERMAMLERERNSRWKKVMRILTGTGP